jgi:hypothetical protein
VDRYQQNRLFQSDQRKVYRKWEGTDLRMSDAQQPDATAMVDFWRSISSVPVEHTEGEWMSVVERECKCIKPMETVTISSEDVSCAGWIAQLLGEMVSMLTPAFGSTVPASP